MKDFSAFSANSNNPKWNNMIKREGEMYNQEVEIRSEFERDYTRIIHTTAYRRMKHKTQVFFSPENDHICTRAEHVAHVESISYIIAKALGLNVELTRAIATAHDIGHSPFGHQGEKILSEISKRDIGDTFWHEKNGLDIVDKIELLEDKQGFYNNLNLTYAVRDGIISHCGEIDENGLKPREEYIDLNDYSYPNEYAPYTWEGCAVKIADKIAYLGRDIKDAITVGILDEHLRDLYKCLKLEESEVINNSVIINELIFDLLENSSPEEGLRFSEEMFGKITELKRFNYEYIYKSARMEPSIRYSTLVINEIYDNLKAFFSNKRKYKNMYPDLIDEFTAWLSDYSNEERNSKNINKIVFNLNNEKDCYKAIIYYIAGMTDNYAMRMYDRIIRF